MLCVLAMLVVCFPSLRQTCCYCCFLAVCNSQTQFTCVQDKRCVLKEKLCDGSFDCADRSDETTAAMCSMIFYFILL